MEAKIIEREDVLVVYLKGRIDIEATEPFRQACLQQLANRKVVFHFGDLSFVGSNGIGSFIDTVREMRKSTNTAMKFCTVGSEFQKVFAATQVVNDIEIYPNEVFAMNAFSNKDKIQVAPVTPAPTTETLSIEPLQSVEKGFIATVEEQEAC